MTRELESALADFYAVVSLATLTSTAGEAEKALHRLLQECAALMQALDVYFTETGTGIKHTQDVLTKAGIPIEKQKELFGFQAAAPGPDCADTKLLLEVIDDIKAASKTAPGFPDFHIMVMAALAKLEEA